MKEVTYEGWTAVFQSTTDYEADLVRDRLDDAGIPAVVMTKRDHAYNLTLGDAAKVFVMVPPTQVEAAKAILAAEAFSDEELTEAALRATEEGDEAERARRTLMDSGIEAIHLSPPDDEA